MRRGLIILAMLGAGGCAQHHLRDAGVDEGVDAGAPGVDAGARRDAGGRMIRADAGTIEPCWDDCPCEPVELTVSTVDDFEPGYPDTPAYLAVDPAGRAHAVWIDFVGRTRHATRGPDDSEWTVERVERLPSSDPVVDRSGALHYVFRTVEDEGIGPARRFTGEVGVVTRTSAGVWREGVIETLPESNRSNGGDTAIRVGPAGALHVVYVVVEDESVSLRHASRVPGEATWTRSTLAEGSVLGRPALDVDAAGRAHVLYVSSDGPTLWHAHREIDEWVRASADRIAAPDARSVRFDGLWIGTVGTSAHLGWSTRVEWVDRIDIAVRYARWTAGALDPPATISADPVGDFVGPAFALGPEGDLHAAYRSPWLELRYARRGSDGAWQTRFLDDDPFRGRTPAIAVDRSGGLSMFFELLGPYSLQALYLPRSSDDWARETLGNIGNQPRARADESGGVHAIFRRSDGTVMHAYRRVCP